MAKGRAHLRLSSPQPCEQLDDSVGFATAQTVQCKEIIYRWWLELGDGLALRPCELHLVIRLREHWRCAAAAALRGS